MPHNQSGAVLIVSLLMLLVTTMLGITSMSTTVMEEKMAGNHRQKQLAFQAADSALRIAEEWMKTNIKTPFDFNTKFAAGAPAELYWQRHPNAKTALKPVGFVTSDLSNWSVGNSIQVTQQLASGQPKPRYIIEYMGLDGEAPLNPAGPKDFRRRTFRITAIGTGTDQTTSYVAQSTFRTAF